MILTASNHPNDAQPTNAHLHTLDEGPDRKASVAQQLHCLLGSNYLMEMMNRSTIYQRHRTRRLKTLALIDDPRPAPVRVMSGLPILSIFFPPYQPQQHHQRRSINDEKHNSDANQHHQTAEAAIAAAPRELFSLSDVPKTEAYLVGSLQDDDNTFLVQFEGEKSNCPTKPDHHDLQASNLKAVALSGFSAAMFSQLIIGNTSTGNNKSVFFPILSSTKHHHHHRHNDLKKRIVRFSLLQPNTRAAAGEPSFRTLPALAGSTTMPRPNMTATAASISTMFAHALSTSCLFTTKVFVERSILNNTMELQDRDEMDRRTWLSSASAIASAVAGGVMANIRNSFMGTTRVSITREMMATTAYFSVYETTKSVLRSPQQKISDYYKNNMNQYKTNDFSSSSVAVVVAEKPKFDMISICIAGGLAGVAYESLLGNWHVKQQQSMLNTHYSIFSTMIKLEHMYWRFVRAVPANALIFLGYEVTMLAFSNTTENS